MSAPPPLAVYAKTPQGSDEVATRRHGLSMRMRQLLILVDGRRTVADLAKLVPEKDLQANLPLLEEPPIILSQQLMRSNLLYRRLRLLLPLNLPRMRLTI